jgi:hypothetical protein
MHGHWRYHYRHAYWHTKHTGTHVDCAGADIYKHTRPKPDALKSSTISSQRHLIVAASLNVIPVCGIHFGLGKRLVFEDVYWFHEKLPFKKQSQSVQ